MGKLKARQIATLRPGRHADGNTLYLVVEPAPSTSRRWVQRIVIRGRRRDLGLGGWPLVTLSEARDAAFDARRIARRGGDPAVTLQKAPTLRQAAEAVERGASWAAMTVQNRRTAFSMYCGDLLDRPITTITRDDVLLVLVPVYRTKRATGKRLRGWLRGAVAWAVAHGHVEVNCVDGVGAGLPNGQKAVEHRPMLPYQEVPEALQQIAESSSTTPAVRACLRFVALTACRSGEARGATWDEIDVAARVWTIPASRMKANREHIVPLTAQVGAVLESMTAVYRDASDLVFPGVGGKVIGASTLLKALHRATGSDTVTVHGMRSSFRTWAGEQTDAVRDVIELALAHEVGSSVERAYARSTLLNKRRVLMQEWGRLRYPRLRLTLL